MKKIIASVPEQTYKKLMKMKSDLDMADESFSGLLVHLAKNTPLRDDVGIHIIRNSSKNLEKLWATNYGLNCAIDKIDIKGIPFMCKAEILDMLENLAKQQEKTLIHGNSINKLEKQKKRPCVIVGGGPSIAKHDHFEKLVAADINSWALVCTTDKMLIPCLKHGIIPDYVVSVDGNPEKIVEFYDDPLVDEHLDKIKALLCTTVHPTVRNRFKGEVYWFNGIIDSADIRDSVTRTFNLMTGITAIATGGNCGTAAFVLMGYLECDPIALIGMDMGYTLDMNFEETEYWHSLLEHLGVTQNLLLLLGFS